MRLSQVLWILPFSAVTATGCIDAATDDLAECAGAKCDRPGRPDACALDGRYENGMCDTDCGSPDIECFLLFDDAAAAGEWFNEFEAELAVEEQRDPRPILAPTDPRFARMRKLLDRGWKSYRALVPVGELSEAPELVVIDDPTVNAFVASDLATSLVGWTVMVQTGLLDSGAPDHEVLGVVMHELEHAVGLHVVPGVGDKMRRHYQVLPGEREPFGAAQIDQAIPREAITAWRELGDEAGPYPFEELAGLPLGQSQLASVMGMAITRAYEANPDACSGAIARFQQLEAFLTPRTSDLDGLLHLDTDDERTTLAGISARLIIELRARCLSTLDATFIELAAERFGVTPEELAAALSPEDAALIDGLPIADQILALSNDRHGRMRDIDANLLADTGGDITTLRYFSTEEAADDRTVPVLRRAGLPADGMAQFMVNRALSPASQDECKAILLSGATPSYGDLIDEHHGTCWRAFHVRELAKRGGKGDYGRMAAPAPTPDVDQLDAYRDIAGPRLPRWSRPSDHTSDALH